MKSTRIRLERLKPVLAFCFTGITLAVGVATWYFSPIKFQADMGILLTFMFLWNMLGALTLLPALAHFLTKRRPQGQDNTFEVKTNRIGPEVGS